MPFSIIGVRAIPIQYNLLSYIYSPQNVCKSICSDLSPHCALHSSTKHITYGNAGNSNNIGKDVGPDGFGARPAAAFGKEVDEGEDLVLTNTLWRRESQRQL